MEATWQIIPDNFSADVYVSHEPAHVPAVALQDGGLFGYGLLRPFRRNDYGDFAADGGTALVRAAVGLVLGTTCNSNTTFGELPWRPEFGSLMERLRLRNNDDELKKLARNFVIEALARWVPSVTVTEAEVVEGRRNTLYLKVGYEIRDQTGTRVLVPGLQTAVALG